MKGLTDKLATSFSNAGLLDLRSSTTIADWVIIWSKFVIEFHLFFLILNGYQGT